MNQVFKKDKQYYKFCFYGFLKNLRFFEPFLILFFLDKNITFLQIGTLYAIREVFINILEIPSGIIADVFGRKKSLIVSFLFYIISFLIFFTSDSYYIFIIAIIFYAIGDAFRTGTHKAMIFDYLKIKGWKDQRVHYYGHTRSWSQMGSAISSLLAASIVFYTGNFKSIFIFSTIPYLLDLLLISTYPKVLDGKNIYSKTDSIKERLYKVLRDFKFSFKNKQILKAIANLSVYSGFHRAIKDYLQAVIQIFALSIPVLLAFSDNQRSAILIGILYFIIYFSTSYASRKAGKLTDKFKSIELVLNSTMYIGFVLAFLSGIFFHYGFYFASIMFYIGIYLIENLRNPVGVAYVSELYQDDILATALSANSQAKSLLAAIIAPIIGFLADRFGIGIGLSSLALLIIISAPLYWAKNKT
ncbi:MAG: MFS transporter [Bacteroidales bacterium]|nr:MFS transporter [Bacteroidales bacterium]